MLYCLKSGQCLEMLSVYLRQMSILKLLETGSYFSIKKLKLLIIFLKTFKTMFTGVRICFKILQFLSSCGACVRFLVWFLERFHLPPSQPKFSVFCFILKKKKFQMSNIYCYIDLCLNLTSCLPTSLLSSSFPIF